MKNKFKVILSSLLVSLMLAPMSAFAFTQVGDIKVPNGTPIVDGVLDQGEWSNTNKVSLTAENSKAWSGELKGPIDFFYTWNDKGLYIAANVTDSNFTNMDDGFQIALNPGKIIADDDEDQGLFYTIKLKDDGTIDTALNNVPTAGSEAISITSEVNGKGKTTATGWEFEALIPWSQIAIAERGCDKFIPGADAFLTSTICYLDNSPEGMNAFKTVLADDYDVADFSTASYPIKLILQGEKKAETTATPETTVAPTEETIAPNPVVDVAPTPTAPQTTDIGIILAVATLATSAGVVLTLKKKNK